MYTFKQRITILGILAILFLGFYGVARSFSPAIVAYVVEQSLLQKAPDGMSPTQARKRFETWLSVARPEDKLMKLLDLSRYLEKVQKLTAEELDRLLAGRSAVGDRAPEDLGNFFAPGDVYSSRRGTSDAGVQPILWRMVA
jgi:hypothetical protein